MMIACDGMGGHAEGERAAEIAVQVLGPAPFPRRARIRCAIRWGFCTGSGVPRISRL